MTAEKGKGEGSLGGSICNYVPLATGELAVAFEETITAGGAELEGYQG